MTVFGMRTLSFTTVFGSVKAYRRDRKITESPEASEPPAAMAAESCLGGGATHKIQ